MICSAKLLTEVAILVSSACSKSRFWLTIFLIVSVHRPRIGNWTELFVPIRDKAAKRFNSDTVLFTEYANACCLISASLTERHFSDT